MAKNSPKRKENVIPIPDRNAPKYFSYREAWGRIKRSIAMGFYLEAVTLEESIISDRLTSYFQKTGVLGLDSKRFVSLGRLIDYLKQHEPEPIRDPLKEPRFENLQQSLDDWRDKRNHVVHGIVKSSGESLDDVENFLAEAKEIAVEGELIALSLNNWYRRFKDKQKTLARKNKG